jgi:glycosyltransferase XagB
VDLVSYPVLSVSLVLFAQAVFSLYLMLYTWEYPERLRASEGPSSFLPPRLSFSVLLPARHEEAVIFETIRKVWEVNYPSELIEIAVICHEDDTGTIAEAEHAVRQIGSPRVRTETFSGGPINKPRGLNVGLERTTNEIVTIFDAEDDIDPDVFNVVNTVMLEEELGVVQAGVQLMNFRDSWFSVHNCLEYFFYFKSRLHFHAKIGMIPLGGNTVFMRRTLMERVGGWDENCLTEDADIGLRLSELGEPIRVVYDAQHVTREETPDSVSSFVRQRTRWNQGFLQILRKGSWLSLPKPKQKLLALYTLSYSVFQGLVSLLWPLAIIGIFLLEVPLGIAMVSFLPLYALVFQLMVTLVGLFQFAKEYGLKVPISVPVVLMVSFLPFQFLLGFSALRAVYRDARNQTNWEKTEHVGAHRGREVPAYEQLLVDALESLNVERGSVMVLDDEQDSFTIKASQGLSESLIGSKDANASDSVAGWVVRNDTSVLINGHEIPADLRLHLGQPNLVSSIVLPIKQDDGTVAVLSLSSKTRELGHEELYLANERMSAAFAPVRLRNGDPSPSRRRVTSRRSPPRLATGHQQPRELEQRRSDSPRPSEFKTPSRSPTFQTPHLESSRAGRHQRKWLGTLAVAVVVGGMIFGWKIPEIITAIWPGILENTRATSQVSAIVADKPSTEQVSGDKPDSSVSLPTRLIGRHRVAVAKENTFTSSSQNGDQTESAAPQSTVAGHTAPEATVPEITVPEDVKKPIEGPVGATVVVREEPKEAGKGHHGAGNYGRIQNDNRIEKASEPTGKPGKPEPAQGLKRYGKPRVAGKPPGKSRLLPTGRPGRAGEKGGFDGNPGEVTLCHKNRVTISVGAHAKPANLGGFSDGHSLQVLPGRNALASCLELQPTSPPEEEAGGS